MSLGTVAGGAIKLDPDEDIGSALYIGEGVETCLSARQMGFAPVWSCISVGLVAAFPVLPRVDCLHILVENDASGASQKAADACARRWHESGREVFLGEPDQGYGDLNDELQASQ